MPDFVAKTPMQIRLLRGNTKIPTYATDDSAGMDLSAFLPEYKHTGVFINPGEVMRIPTGVAIWIRDALLVGYVYPRSGTASKKGLILANTVGVIDADYQGEILLMIRNVSSETQRIEHGDRIAQIVFQPIVKAQLHVIEEFSNATARGEGALGSTGT